MAHGALCVRRGSIRIRHLVKPGRLARKNRSHQNRKDEAMQVALAKVFEEEEAVTSAVGTREGEGCGMLQGLLCRGYRVIF